MKRPAGAVAGSGGAPARQLALEALIALDAGQSLSSMQAGFQARMPDGRERALWYTLVYGVARWQGKLDAILQRLLRKPPRNKDADIRQLLRLALYELLDCRSPDYAVLNEAVSLTRWRRKKWASGLVNGVLRHFLREREAILADLDEFEMASHPRWMLERFRQDWPRHWEDILAANNVPPPLWLRVNVQRDSLEACQQRLQQQGLPGEQHPRLDTALRLLVRTDVARLPGLAEGAVSVQDAGAQLAAGLLQARAGERVLDLCAAPGGKTGHLLEREPTLQLVAVDRDPARMARLEENLQRLGLGADCRVLDVLQVAAHWPEASFDRVLLDAPCSASGVIRRHPDIKQLRREADLAELETLQAAMLDVGWRMLKPGGRLLYVTCSVFRQENDRQIARFLERTRAVEVSLANAAPWGVACEHGWQLLPEPDGSDGFYYCLLEKPPAA